MTLAGGSPKTTSTPVHFMRGMLKNALVTFTLLALGFAFTQSDTDSVRVEVADGAGLIDYVDFSLDGGRTLRDPTPPFTYEVSKSGLEPGEHTIDLNLFFTLFDEVSVVRRTRSFTVRPFEGRVCPAFVHDRYMTGWNGSTYRTWHPQIDPDTGCYFDHEHGSDPAGFAGGLKPVFDAFVGRSSPITGDTPLTSEAHSGFKVVVFERGGVSAMITTHLTGTMSTHRLCAMFHTQNTTFADAATGEVLANLMYKGDYGKPVAQTGFGTQAPMRHRLCPERADLTGIHGSIFSPVVHADGEEANGYETWVLDTYGLRAPLTGKFIVRVDETRWQCSRAQNAAGEYTCPEDFRTLEAGRARDNIERWFDLSNDFGIDTTLPDRQVGNFCTDYTMMLVLACSDPQSVPQYVKPGVRFAFLNERYWVPTANAVNTGLNAFKFEPGQPQERDYNLGGVHGDAN